MEAENEDGVQKKGRHRKKQLYNTILQQLEFYFSDSNLTKDRYLSQLMKEDPFVDLTQFLNFNKIRKLTTNIDDLRKSIRKSEILELSEDSEKIRRKTEVKVKENVDECTIYVEKISSDANHEFLSTIFSDFGNVAYVSVPKYKHNQMNKGFAFVEFDTENEAKNALDYFESIGCKMASNINPKDLCSISSFIKESQINSEEINKKSDDESETKKRKQTIDDSVSNKKAKVDDNQVEVISHSEEGEAKRKKKKEHKKKSLIRELGWQVLSKNEWKKMRNSYLNSQRKKMSEVKMHLHKSKMKHKNHEIGTQNKSAGNDNAEETPAKLEYIPGTIVRIKLPEPCQSDKKIKMEVKAAAKDAKYVDVPFSSCSEIFVRFLTNEAAQKFCNEEFNGTKDILEGDEETLYWEKINNDRNFKFQKTKKKERGKDKLLRKVEKHLVQHTRFDEND